MALTLIYLIFREQLAWLAFRQFSAAPSFSNQLSLVDRACPVVVTPALHRSVRSSARPRGSPGRSYRPVSSATSGAKVSATLAPKAK